MTRERVNQLLRRADGHVAAREEEVRMSAAELRELCALALEGLRPCRRPHSDDHRHESSCGLPEREKKSFPPSHHRCRMDP